MDENGSLSGLVLSGLLIASLVLCVMFSVPLPICHVSPSHHVLDLRMSLSLLLSSSGVLCYLPHVLVSAFRRHNAFYGVPQHDVLQKTRFSVREQEKGSGMIG